MEGILKLKYAFVSLLISFGCLSGNEINKYTNTNVYYGNEMWIEQRKYLAIKMENFTFSYFTNCLRKS